MTKTLALFLLAYPLFLAFSISFADYTTPLSYRIMLPEFVAALLLAWGTAFKLCRKSRKSRLALKILAALVLTTYAARAYHLCAAIYSDGLGYSSRKWRRSKLIAYIERLPRNSRIFTNATSGVYYLTGRNALPLPKKWLNGKTNPEYQAELKILNKTLSEQNFRIVYFKTVPSSLLPTINELREALSADVALETNDGVVLQTGSEKEANRQ